MSIRDRLEVHRKDILALLEQASATAKLHPSSELAGAISSIARAQMLLAEELGYLEEEELSPCRRDEVIAESEDATAVHCVRPR